MYDGQDHDILHAMCVELQDLVKSKTYLRELSLGISQRWSLDRPTSFSFARVLTSFFAREVGRLSRQSQKTDWGEFVEADWINVLVVAVCGSVMSTQQYDFGDDRLQPLSPESDILHLNRLSPDLLIDTVLSMERMMIDKGHDYSGSRHTWTSFERSSSIAHYDVMSSFLILIATKVTRLESLFTVSGPPKFESVQDTLIDLANYIVLLITYARWLSVGVQR